MCVCVRARARACVCVCPCVCDIWTELIRKDLNELRSRFGFVKSSDNCRLCCTPVLRSARVYGPPISSSRLLSHLIFCFVSVSLHTKSRNTPVLRSARVFGLSPTYPPPFLPLNLRFFSHTAVGLFCLYSRSLLTHVLFSHTAAPR